MPTTVNETPRYTITIAGVTISQSDPKGLEYLLVEDHLEMVGMAELTFVGGSGLAWEKMEIGGEVEIILGGESAKFFIGTITGIQHTYQRGKETLTVTALDDLAKLAASRVTKTYESMTDSNIASSVISDGGASPGTVDSTSETRDYTIQRNESNLTFLHRLASKNNFIVTVTEGKVDFKAAQFSAAPTEIPKEQLITLNYGFSNQNIPESLTVYGWDPNSKETVEGTASSSDIEAIGGGGNAVSSTGQIYQGSSYISDVLVENQADAKAMAVAELNRLARNYLRGRAIVQGNSALRAGTKVKFVGHRAGFNPEVYIIGSKHRIMHKSGFTTEILFCSNTEPE